MNDPLVKTLWFQTLSIGLEYTDQIIVLTKFKKIICRTLLLAKLQASCQQTASVPRDRLNVSK